MTPTISMTRGLQKHVSEINSGTEGTVVSTIGLWNVFADKLVGLCLLKYQEVVFFLCFITYCIMALILGYICIVE